MYDAACGCRLSFTFENENTPLRNITAIFSHTIAVNRKCSLKPNLYPDPWPNFPISVSISVP